MTPLLLTLITSPAIHLYWSPEGDDNRDGRSAKTAVRSFAKLRDQVVANQGQPMVIHILGKHRLEQPITFDAPFAGVTLDGKGGTLSGGKLITGWTQVPVPAEIQPAIPNPASPVPANGKVGVQVRERVNPGTDVEWHAPFRSEKLIHQLTVGSVRRPLARLPETGYFFMGDRTAQETNAEMGAIESSFSVKPADAHLFADTADVEVLCHHFWVTSRFQVKKFDPATLRVEMDRPSVMRLSDSFSGKGASYVLYNVRGGLRPGRFFQDRNKGELVYRPVPGERLPRKPMVVPIAPALIEIQGADGIKVQDLALEDTEWVHESSGDVQAAYSVPGAINIRKTKGVTLSNLWLHRVGSYGVYVTDGSTGTQVLGCRMEDLGAGGVNIDSGTSGTTVADCRIERAGRLHPSAVGILVRDSGHNTIVHNRIYDLFYTGISSGWTWGYTPTQCDNNLIEWNDISLVGQGRLNDMGGIYILGPAKNCLVAHNFIADVESNGYGGWGIYMDEGATQIQVKQNLTVRTSKTSFHQHYGRENLIQQNVFLEAATEGLVQRSRTEDHLSLTLDRNVWVTRADLPFLSPFNSSAKGLQSTGNVAWSAGNPAFEGVLVKNPRIKLKGKSATITDAESATRLGFSKLDLSAAGPRR